MVAPAKNDFYICFSTGDTLSSRVGDPVFLAQSTSTSYFNSVVLKTLRGHAGDQAVVSVTGTGSVEESLTVPNGYAGQSLYVLLYRVAVSSGAETLVKVSLEILEVTLVGIVTITYKGNTLATLDITSATATLLTAGRYMEDDIAVEVT